MTHFTKTPKKYHPKGFEILYEDQDIIVGNKAPGFLTVAAKWERVNTIHYALHQYVRKGQVKSPKRIHVVHRLDQATSGVLIFAKSEKVKDFLKDNWKDMVKTYYTIVHGKLNSKTGIITSYLEEDEEYMMHSTQDKKKGRLAQTQYEVLKENDKYSLVKINLLTGRKNQIRVHMADQGHSVVGDDKYGKELKKYPFLALHSQSLTITHPFNKKRLTFEAKTPDYFSKLVHYTY